MTIEKEEDIPRWYVVHTNPKQEERANNNLRAWGVETLNPKLRMRRFNQFTGAPSYISQPLFPRYIFAKFNACRQLPKIWFTRGVHEIVSFGGKPASVDEDIIRLIHDRIDNNGFVQIGDDLKCGDKVVVKAGPLRNFSGIFERELKEKDRVIVLLTAISYQGCLVVSRDLLQRVPGTSDLLGAQTKRAPKRAPVRPQN
jgi:transcriptional antiterminator RfaH